MYQEKQIGFHLSAQKKLRIFEWLNGMGRAGILPIVCGPILRKRKQALSNMCTIYVEPNSYDLNFVEYNDWLMLQLLVC